MEVKDELLAVTNIAARNKDKDKPEYKEFIKAYQSEAVRKFIADKYKGTIEPAF
ncbi:MAG: MetQ/NlpA family ABC transporter substrate-binding protein [Phascolarctobacterium sp.]|uniref:MetQ/NlpA family ABC transporter substrate-binding protein n=1 Tax=Phascolarctobacterium sp. TaxID=2049039 RepID=UPI0026DCE9B0|nr:MetQ/NlpA family ABC transporter substrate-binding protein [Phascolarctobacterium sp.]MDO4922202.1 MetQ/NlpA family ABC transporter substrate-binding protein [Phascolarctobacterium sp.]